MIVYAPKKHGLAVITNQQYEEAKDRYMHGESAEIIARDLRCKRCVLDTRFSRDGLPAKRLERLKEGRGERLKDKIGAVTEKIVDSVAEKEPKSLEGLNLQADTLQKATKTASLVYGWGDQTNVAIIVAGDITGDPAPEVIDVETVADGQQDEQKP